MDIKKESYELKNTPFVKTTRWVTSNKSTKIHFHDCIEIGCCIGGEGEFVFSDKKYAVGKGDIFIAAQLEPHICSTNEDNPATFIYLFFKPSSIIEFMPAFLNPYIYNPKLFNNKIPFGSETSSEISRLVQNIHSELTAQDLSYISLVKSYMVQICVLLSRHYNNQPATDMKSANANAVYNFDKIRQVAEYIKDNLDKEISLKKISEVFYMSESRLRHLFKEITGIGIKDYITNYRIENAKQLIIETDDSLSCICEKCGFQSVSSFYRAFKDITGYSPAKFREL